MDVPSLYTNIPQEEGITIVCNAYENFDANDPPIGTNFLREMLSLILKVLPIYWERLSPNTRNCHGH